MKLRHGEFKKFVQSYTGCILCSVTQESTMLSSDLLEGEVDHMQRFGDKNDIRLLNSKSEAKR